MHLAAVHYEYLSSENIAWLYITNPAMNVRLSLPHPLMMMYFCLEGPHSSGWVSVPSVDQEVHGGHA